ncbi:uncharacterized protein [Henckelia pumila]|uniref:uncharacterized protein n=1 Tax=Henckelia pumila TaxID=405737 RepID=UPI003C6DC438
MTTDTTLLVHKCEGCQRHGRSINHPATILKPIMTACPFDKWDMDIVGPFPTAPTQKKFLIVAIYYFSKWVEAEALARITETNVLRFLWRNIVCRFGVPRDENCSILYLCGLPPSKRANREAVLPAVIGASSAWVLGYGEENTDRRAADLDIIEETRERALIRMEAYWGRMTRAYNKRVRLRNFQVGELVSRKAQPTREVGKLDPKCEGPLKITQKTTAGAYYLEDDQGRSIKRPWNIYHLKKYYA